MALTTGQLIQDAGYERATCGMHPDLLQRIRASVAAGAPAPLCDQLLKDLQAATAHQSAAILLAPPMGAATCVAQAGRSPPDIAIWLLLDPLDIDSKQTTFVRGDNACMKRLYKWSPPQLVEDCEEQGSQAETDQAAVIATDLTVEVGTVVRRNSNWDAEWGQLTIHPPPDITGTVVGFTDRTCTVFGDSGPDFDNIARIRWEGSEDCRDVRIGFAGEFWLECISGAVQRQPPVEYGGLFNCTDDPEGFAMCHRQHIEDQNGQCIVYQPPAPSMTELASATELQLFWRVHAGDVDGVSRLLKEHPDGLVDARCLPFNYPSDKDEVPWPYQRFDGCYNDTAAMLACRYNHSAMLQLLIDRGADLTLTNDDRDSCASITIDISKQAQYAFSDEQGNSKILELLPLVLPDAQSVEPRAVGHESVCVRGSFCELSSCGDAASEGMQWMIVNGHSDPDQVGYCQNMVDQWKQTLTERGDTIAHELTCPSKVEFSGALRELFQTSTGAACGLFVICHGGEGGQWVSFNPADQSEKFSWEDVEEAGLYDGPAQFFVVGDSCYSAKLGKTGFAAVRSRHLSGERVPVCSMLMASERPEKNFSCMFALQAMSSRRKLTRSACERVAAEALNSDCKAALEVVEDIHVETDDHDPFFFFYAPVDAVTADSVIYTL